MSYEFRWNDWNVGHLAEHGVSPSEAEYVVASASRPYPRKIGNGKFLIRGRTQAAVLLQVILVFDPAPMIYIIHARPLSETEKWRFRRELR
jgi:hypothetical protein